MRSVAAFENRSVAVKWVGFRCVCRAGEWKSRSVATLAGFAAGIYIAKANAPDLGNFPL